MDSSSKNKSNKKPRKSTKSKAKPNGEEDWPEYFQHVSSVLGPVKDVTSHARLPLSPSHAALQGAVA